MPGISLIQFIDSKSSQELGVGWRVMTSVLQMRKWGAEMFWGLSKTAQLVSGEAGLELRIPQSPSSGFSIGPSCHFHSTSIDGDRCCVADALEWGTDEPGPPSQGQLPWERDAPPASRGRGWMRLPAQFASWGADPMAPPGASPGALGTYPRGGGCF